MGTYQIAILAKAFKKPFYVAVESYKFARMYPLSQRDLHEWSSGSGSGRHGESSGMYSSGSGGSVTQIKNKNLNNILASSGHRVTSTLPITHAHSMNSDEPATSVLTGDCTDSHKNNHNYKDEFDTPKVDFTPSEYITLLFTDLGVLTPAAVSDELIRLYQ